MRSAWVLVQLAKDMQNTYFLLAAAIELFLACLYKSTGRAIALPLVSSLATAVALTKTLKFCVKVFKTLYFLNPQMHLVYIWYDYRCWSKILLSTLHTPAHDLEDLEILC